MFRALRSLIANFPWYFAHRTLRISLNLATDLLNVFRSRRGMSRLDSIPVSLITILCALVSGACASHSTDDQKLLTCFKCLGNDTECRDICTGYYCYKYEIKGHMSGPVKKGCLNATDALSKVDECTLRNTTIGKLSVAENFCLCTTDRSM
ncbi:hypothetical protein KIN20_012540 [Parelaphostrongylus tenuis]|uniref:Uncharacterized protein n=1 Tax=Parelaphostrongylus tenuis TaxID=148309 RepID=A0AAD5MFD2_PARTN|nr:hypothetical protein KIN20_012540 [Parelaphostrongylus tenuis]